MNTTKELTPEAVSALALDAKIGLLATVTDDLPHITLITSIHAKTPAEIMWGQFSEGLSKAAVRVNPRVGFLVMNQAKQVFRGSARWTRAEASGDDYAWYNRKPLFRYNSYFGIHTVHYMDVVETFGDEALSMPSVIAGTLLTSAARLITRTPRNRSEGVLKPWAKGFVNKADTMKFLAWVADDGYPRIVPVVPSATPDGRRIIVAPTVFQEELRGLREGTPVAVFALNLAMESVLARGRFNGFNGFSGGVLGKFSLGSIDLDWVYNSMPPKQGQIYPELPLEAVTSF
jgi:hypothetical protein